MLNIQLADKTAATSFRYFVYHVDDVMSVAFWSPSALEHIQGTHHQRHIRCLSRVWSGSTVEQTWPQRRPT